jgi:hypothetical protein
MNYREDKNNILNVLKDATYAKSHTSTTLRLQPEEHQVSAQDVVQCANRVPTSKLQKNILYNVLNLIRLAVKTIKFARTF